jgi:hypothetical protein
MRANCDTETAGLICGSELIGALAVIRSTGGAEALKTRGFRADESAGGGSADVDGLMDCGLGRKSASASLRALLISWRSSLQKACCCSDCFSKDILLIA